MNATLLSIRSIRSIRRPPSLQPKLARPSSPTADRPKQLIRLVGLCVALAALLGCAGDSDREPQRSKDGQEIDLQLLNPALQPLRRDFEAAYGHTRLVAVLSSSCSQCLDNGRRLFQTGIPKLQEMGIVVFYVWGSPLPSDTRIRARDLAEEMAWTDLHHYYDDSGRVTRAFGRTMELAPGINAYDIFFLYGPEATWDPQGTMDQEPEDMNVASVFWAPSRPDRWWGDPERYPGFQQMWVAEILAAVGADSTSAEP